MINNALIGDNKSGGHRGRLSLPARASLLLISAAVLITDRVTKHLVVANIPLWQDRTVMPGFFHLTHLENRGAAFSLFTRDPSPWKLWLLIGFSAIALCVVLYLLFRSQYSRLAGIGLALIVGGAVGNMWDRIVNGRVVDFLDFFVTISNHRYDWPPFNAADTAIVVGAGLLLLELLFFSKPTMFNS